MIKGCASCNYENFPPDAVPCVYCDAGDQFVPIEESEDEDQEFFESMKKHYFER